MFERTDKHRVVKSYFESITEWYSAIKFDRGDSGPWVGGWNNNREVYEASLSSNKYAERINKVVSQLVGMVQASMFDTQLGMDVTGLGYDVGLALSGVPECWLTVQPSNEPRVVKILINIMVSAMVKPEQVMARGIGVCALVKCLEMSGVSTEIWVCAGNCPDVRPKTPKGLQCFVKLKSTSDYFDLEKFSFAICDVGFCRKLMFSWQFQRSGAMGNSNLLGWNEDFSEETKDIFLERMYGKDPQFENIETTKAWVIEKCREFGVEISNPPLA
jgi:hypothetical protein